jgi:dipeptidyl aminopeptidase/acylaminoacyl peptidase
MIGLNIRFAISKILSLCKRRYIYCLIYYLLIFIATIQVTLIGKVHAEDYQTTDFRSDDLHKLKSIREVKLSPDGKYIAYTVQYRDHPGRPYTRMWIMDVEANISKPLREDHSTGSNLRWSPDGRLIAYLGKIGDDAGIIVIDANGLKTKFLASVQGTNHPLPSMGDRLTWSPDSRKIAFISATPGPEKYDANGDPRVITRYLYKPYCFNPSTPFNDNKRLHIFVVDIETKEIQQLTYGNYNEHSLDWSPKGDEILFVSNREPDPDQFFNYDIFTVKISDGTIRRLTSTENAEYCPRWSPDGKMIAYQGTRRGLTSSETTMEDTHIWVMSANGSNRHELGKAIDNRQGAPAWSAEGSAVYFTVQERGNVHLYRLPIQKGQPRKIINEKGVIRSWSISKEDIIAYAFNSLKDLPQLYIKKKGEIKKLTHLNTELLTEKHVANVEAFTFLSYDGLEVEAFLTQPHLIKEDSKHPLIVMIKGGPHGQRGTYFNFKAQVYACRGWASLMVNYRGSTGYGQQFTDAIFKDQNGGEAKDVIYGTEAALRRYAWLDRDRVGVEGGSYGGQLTNWLITQTSLFKAAIPIAGISNLLSFNYMAYYHDYLAIEFGAFPHQDNLMDFLWERSPLKHVAKVKTPVMFIHGENDNDVPIAEAEQFYIALKDVGVETIMVRYPREGHGIRETKHVVDMINRCIAWYEKHFIASEVD